MGQLSTTLLHFYSAADVPDLSGKTAVVTGANSGIGYHTALELGRKGAKVVCLCRDAVRGTDAVERMKQAAPSGSFELVLCDLSNLESVKAAAEALLKRGAAVDILVNNAGIMMPPKRESSAEGFEAQMATNHLGHFALTGRLLPLLQKASTPRVVNVSSLMAWSGDLKGTPGLDFRVPKDQYSPVKCYGNSKLANLVFTLELARRFPQLTVTAAHPGGTSTNLQTPPFDGPVFRTVLMPGWKGALSSLRAATDPELKSGAYIGPWLGGHGVPTNTSAMLPPQARDAELGRRLWTASQEATNLTF